MIQKYSHYEKRIKMYKAFALLGNYFFRHLSYSQSLKTLLLSLIEIRQIIFLILLHSSI